MNHAKYVCQLVKVPSMTGLPQNKEISMIDDSFFVFFILTIAGSRLFQNPCLCVCFLLIYDDSFILSYLAVHAFENFVTKS